MIKTFARRHRAHQDYLLLKQLEAGLSLTGMEVKAVKTQGMNLDQALIKLKGNEVFLLNAHIPRYRFATDRPYDPRRTRKLLLHRRQIRLLASAQEKRLALVPLSCYQKNGWLKLKIGIGRRRKKFEKRERLLARASAKMLAKIQKQAG